MAILRATSTFIVANRVIREGDLVEDSDPAIPGREHLFESVEAEAKRRTAVVSETTSAEPGRPRRRTKSN